MNDHHVCDGTPYGQPVTNIHAHLHLMIQVHYPASRKYPIVSTLLFAYRIIVDPENNSSAAVSLAFHRRLQVLTNLCIMK
jgi:hypothetical protein